MTRTAYDISNTGITGEYGQFNSSVNDFKIGISQSIKFQQFIKDKNNSLLKKLKGQWNEAIQKGIDFTSTNAILQVCI
jgi:cobalt-zinc-cadmium resistance protein CzcA